MSYKFKAGDQVRIFTGAHNIMGIVTQRSTLKELKDRPVEVLWDDFFPNYWYSDKQLTLIPTALDKLDEIL